MAVNNVLWNPAFDQDSQDRIFSQLDVFYQGNQVAQLKEQLTALKGKKLLSDAYSVIQLFIQQNQKKVIIASEIAKKRLTLADQAIAFAKSKLMYGPGNQLEAWSVTKGNSRMRKDQGKNALSFGQKDMGANSFTTGSIALVALANVGTTCRGYAALVYEYLRIKQQISKDDLNIWSIAQGDHVMIVLGKPEDVDAVAVDAWPTHAQALMFKDHFAHSKGFKKGTLVPGDSQPLKFNKSTDVLAKDLIAQDDNELTLTLYQLTPCCTSDLSSIIYVAESGSWPSPTVHSEKPFDNPPAVSTLEGEKMRLNAMVHKTLPEVLG